MNCNVINTGSDGNAVVVNGNILIDCGVPFSKLVTVYNDLSLVLLTHIHCDHFQENTIKRLGWERPRLRFGCCEWLVLPLLKAGIKKRNIDVLTPGQAYDYKFARVEPFELYHNVPNCGYKLEVNGEKGFYATDTGDLEDITAPYFDLYMIEANHGEAEILERIRQKQEEGIYPYEKEVMSNHLSREQADEFLTANAGVDSQIVYLHQHKERKLNVKQSYSARKADR